MVYPMTTLVTCQFFLPRNAMHSANYRKSVCLYISLSHDGILSKRLNIPIIKRFSPSGSHTNQFFAVQCTKRYGSIPTVISLTGASNVGGMKICHQTVS